MTEEEEDNDSISINFRLHFTHYDDIDVKKMLLVSTVEIDYNHDEILAALYSDHPYLQNITHDQAQNMLFEGIGKSRSFVNAEIYTIIDKLDKNTSADLLQIVNHPFTDTLYTYGLDYRTIDVTFILKTEAI